MKKLFLYAIVLLTFGIVGCGTTSKEIARKSQGGKSGVFTEVRGTEPVPIGLVDLIIKANIKTHAEEYYLLESKESLHGKQKYPFIINIDGQAVRWEVDGVKDIKADYHADGKTSRDPEAGEGFKYILEKRVRLTAGMHKLFFGLPEDEFFTELEILLKEGETGTLEFEPIYKTKNMPTRIPTFMKGIYKYDVFLNGRQIS